MLDYVGVWSYEIVRLKLGLAFWISAHICFVRSGECRNLDSRLFSFEIKVDAEYKL